MWNFDVREQARSTRYAPRVFVAGPMISTAKPPWSPPQVADPPLVVATTPEQSRALVEKQALFKTAFIKIWSMPAVLSQPPFPVVESAHTEGPRPPPQVARNSQS